MNSFKSKHVKVVIRTRPTAAFAQDILNFSQDKKVIHIHIPKNQDGGYINNQQEDWDFRFDHIMHNASQEMVYEECGTPIVKSLLDGYNGTILAYGQTGAGKTFTMTGATENFKHRGIIPRSIAQTFKEISDRPDSAYTVRISYVEIYKETMIDLLSNLSEDNKSSNQFTVVEEKNGSTYVRGLNTQLVTSEEEALNLLFEGEMNRSISEHQLNKNSSRAHCIFTIHLESRSRVESSEKVISSKLNLVDLAGSERLSKTETNGITLKEAMYINRSLTFLEQVIIALADKKRDHIPYRQSKMTHVLKDSLGGNCNTLMIANIWGEKEHIEETISTLRFATRMMCVSNTPEINIQYDPLALIKKYEREIKDLKQELSMHDTFSNRSHVQYEAYSDAQRYDLQKQVKSYVNGEVDEIEIINLRQIKEIMNLFRNLYKDVEAEKDLLARNPQGAATGRREPIHNSILETNNRLPIESEKDDGVGEVDGAGFGIGIAPTGGKSGSNKAAQKDTVKRSAVKKTLNQFLSSPSVKDSLSNIAVLDDNHENTYDALTNINRINEAADNHAQTYPKERRVGAPLSRAEEFETFKAEKGLQMYQNLMENKSKHFQILPLDNLKDKRKIARDYAETLNTLKTRMDSLKSEVESRKSEREALESKGIVAQQVIIDEEEYKMIQSIKTLKQEYQKNYDDLKNIRSEIDYCSHLVDQCRQKFMTEFEQWYESIYGGGQSFAQSILNSQGDDVLDIGEKFDRLQIERMSAEDPDSLPYYNAKKNTQRRNQKKIPISRVKSIAT